MFDNIKRILSDDALFYSLLLLLVGVCAFGLGRWSAHSAPQPGGQGTNVVVRQETIQGVSTVQSGRSATTDTETGQFVASKNGSKYHFPWCPGAQQMKEENKVWFDSKEEAEAAGYTPAANCKGL